MKKFLSVLLTMAMVLTLFSGTVLAANPADFTVVVGTATKDVDMKDFASPGHTIDYEIYDTVPAPDGPNLVAVKIGAKVPTNNILSIETAVLNLAKTKDSESYNLILTNKSDSDATHTVAITVIQSLSINGVSSSPTVVLGERNVFTGTVTNRGAAVTGKQVSLKDGGTVLGLATTDSDGAFSFDAPITAAKAYDIYVGAVKYTSTKMSVVEDIKVEVKKSPATVRDTSKIVDINLSGITNAPVLVDGLFYLVNITLPTGDVEVYSGTTVVSAAGVETVPSFTLAKLLAGEYKVEAAFYLSNPSSGDKTIANSSEFKPYRSGKASFTIVDNSDKLYSIIRVLDDSSGVPATYVYYSKDIPVSQTTDYKVDFDFTAPGDGTIKINEVAYKVTGPVVTEISDTEKGLTQDKESFVSTKTFKVNSDGVLVISGTVTYSNNKIETFEKTITVKGLHVEYTPEELGKVNDDVEVVVILTNDKGEPVHNARVTINSHAYGVAAATNTAFKVWDGEEYVAVAGTNNVINGQTTNIQNGRYSKKIKLVEPGEIKILVEYYDGAWKEAAYTQKIIYGADVYKAEEVKALIATKSNQTVTFKLTNEAGVSVKPTYAYLDDPNGISGLTNPLTPYTYSGNNLQLKFNPTEVGTFNVLIGSDSGAKMAVVPVTVVAPEVTVKVNEVESDKVTAGILEKIDVVFDDVATSSISVTVKDLDGNVYTDAGNTALVGPKNTNNGAVTFYAKNTIFKDSKEGTLEITANFGVAATTVKVATLKVVAPSLSIGFETLEVGTVVDLDLHLTDANGNGLKGYEIKSAGSDAFAGNATAKTDEDGKAILTVSPNAPGTLTLEVPTLKPYDNDNTVGDTAYTNAVKYTLAVPVVRDTTGPTFHLEDVYTVSTFPATITFKVTDSSKVTEVWIGYEKALVRPDGSVLFTLSSLPIGVSEFDLLAYDYYGNASEATLVIKYSIPTKYELTIGSTEATKDGAPIIGMDQAPVIKDSRTFLPVRFVLETLMGGTMEWDSVTRTITSVVDGHTIKMVIGSKTAYVDGEAIEMDVAPYIEPDTSRTLVPLRIMEAIGYVLEWNDVTRTVTILIP